MKEFRSDFHDIADYLSQRRTNPEYVPEARVIRHVDAFFKMLEAITGERGMIEELQRQHKEGKETRTMKDFFEHRDKVAMEKGKAEGKAEGIRVLMRKLNYSEAEAMDFLELAEEEREACRKLLHEQKIA